MQSLQIDRALGQIFPFTYQRGHIATIRSRVDNERYKEKRGVQLRTEWMKYEALSRPDLTDSLRSDLLRREGLQRRAQSFLGTVAVMSAFTIGTIGLSRSALTTVPVAFVAIGIAVTLAYLAGGAWSALRIMKPEQVYDLFLQDRVPEDAPLDDGGLKQLIIYSIHMNQAYNLIFSAYSERAYRCVRNGFLTLVMVLALLVLDQGIGAH